jgi:hypothetical protein
LKAPFVIFGAALIALQAGWAGTFSGNFTTDDNVVLIPFTVVTSSIVTMQTTSFGDGSGGFEPVLTLFDGAGNFLYQDATGGILPFGCGARAIDPISGSCSDAYIQAPLSPDTYTLALSEWDNIPSGPTLADGFPQSGNGNFTGTEFLCGAGGFFLSDCSQRNTNWTVEIEGSGLLGAPEPMPVALITPAILMTVVAARRRRK